MDDSHFDRLTIALTERLSRRGFGRFGAAVLAALGLAPPHDEAAAAKESTHRRDKRRGRRHDDRHDEEQRSARVKAAARKKKPRCVPNCAGKTCGSNGCGGSCGTCRNGFVCSSLSKGGTCRCPSGVTCTNGRTCCPTGQQCAGTTCCPAARACGTTCCPSGERCANGACCAEARVCAGVCCAPGETCVDDQCCPDARACGGDTCCAEDETCLGNACCPTTNACNGEECCTESETCLAGGCCADDRVCADDCCTGDENCLGDTCCPDDRVCGETCCEREQTCLDEGCCPDAKVCDGACCAAGERCVDAACCPEAAVCHGTCCGEDETCLGSGEHARCCPDAAVCHGTACCGEGQTCLADGCCPADRVCNGETCCANGETCLASGCCADERVCHGSACCGPNQTCTTQDGCCPPARVCGNGALCCPAGEACIGEACCPEARGCGAICCEDGQTCLGGACCATSQVCAGVCCAGNETCLGSECCPNDRICNNTECCGPNRTCLASGCCPTDRACSGVCCAANETCVDGACCAAPCGAICCAGDQQCVGTGCCPEARVCGNACCVPGETCQGGSCAPPLPPAPLTCGDCGYCQRCDANAQTERAECAKPCSDACLAQSLCQRARNSPEALRLAEHLISMGYRQVEQPIASVLEEERAFIAKAVAVPYARPANPDERATLILSVDADGAAQTHVRRNRNKKLEEVVFAVPGAPGAAPAIVPFQARISVTVTDESQVSNATCAVCRGMCGFSMNMLNIRDFWEGVRDIKDVLDLPKTIDTVGLRWPKLLGDLRAKTWPDFSLPENREAASVLLEPIAGLIDVQDWFINRAVEAGLYDEDPNVDPCGMCSADGFCCRPGRRDCQLENALEFTACVPEGECCENGVEGTCPPGIGSFCVDFRSDKHNCGGCPGQGGMDCGTLVNNPDNVVCSHRECKISQDANCDPRGGFVTSFDDAHCCRRGDTHQNCPGIGNTCAAAGCCTAEQCPGDPCRNPCGAGQYQDPASCACLESNGCPHNSQCANGTCGQDLNCADPETGERRAVCMSFGSCCPGSRLCGHDQFGNADCRGSTECCVEEMLQGKGHEGAPCVTTADCCGIARCCNGHCRPPVGPCTTVT